MPVRSLSSFVLRWPDAQAVGQAVRRWAEREGRVHPEVVRYGRAFSRLTYPGTEVFHYLFRSQYNAGVQTYTDRGILSLVPLRTAGLRLSVRFQSW